MIITHVIVSIKPQLEQECLRAMHTLAKESRLEIGNVSYDFYKSLEEACTYILVEVWKDQEAVEAHNLSEHFKSFMAESVAKRYTVSQKVATFSGEQIMNG